MALKSLKSYGLKFKELQGCAKELNEAELAPAIKVSVGVKGEDLLSSFMDAIEQIPDKQMKDIPKDVSIYYDAIPQEAFDDDADSGGAPETPEDKEVKEVEVAKEDEVTSSCPVFKKGWDDNEPDCKECKEDTNDEYEACKKAVKAKGKTKKAKKDKAKVSKKNAGKRTRYGHMPGSMSGRIDDLVQEGHTKEDMVSILMKEFKRKKPQATGKVTAHLKRLVTKLSIEVTEKKDGVLKAKQKYAETFNKDNTVSGS